LSSFSLHETIAKLFGFAVQIRWLFRGVFFVLEFLYVIRRTYFRSARRMYSVRVVTALQTKQKAVIVRTSVFLWVYIASIFFL